MTKTLRREFVYPQDPPERVWAALTDPRALAEWLMPNTFKPVVGHKFIFQVDPMPGCGHMTECEVLECDPPCILAYSWTVVTNKPNKPKLGPMKVTWQLAREGNGTRLVFTHEGLDMIPWWMGLMMKFGWSTMHKRWIPKVLRNVDAAGTFTPGAIPLHKRCYKCKTVPAEVIR
jgi:uncharacterized protein YndB with AHSA1/START domain